MSNDKQLPYDTEAEEAVVGSLLIDGEAIYEVANFLKADDFFTQQNRFVYEACYHLYERGVGINQITVADELVNSGHLEDIGGTVYLSRLVSMVPTSLHIEHYGQIVSRLAVMRHLIRAANDISAIGYAADADVDASLSRAEDTLFKVRRRESQGDFISVKQILGNYFDETIATEVHPEQVRYIPTGYAAIDDLLIGLQRSNLVILAARPSMGKTSLALNITRNVAINQRGCVALFSLEMSRQELVQRLLASEANVSSTRIRQGNFIEEEEARVMEASGILSEASIYIDDSPQLRAIEARSKARRLHFERTVDLVVIDYLQLMKSEAKSENRVQELSEITRSLKALARELDAPVLVLSQLSRAIEWRSSHKPQLSDLRDSGSIEQDADVVLFINREEHYIKKDEWEKQHAIDMEPYPEGIADIILEKHRNGPIGERKLQFDAKTTKFKDLLETRLHPSVG